MTQTLEETGLPYSHFEDDGDHFSMISQRLGESIEFFSEFLDEDVAPVITSVSLIDGLTTTWGQIRTHH